MDVQRIGGKLNRSPRLVDPRTQDGGGEPASTIAVPAARIMVGSADFAPLSFRGARQCNSRFEVLEVALQCIPRAGLVCEFGVFEGASIRQISRALPGRQIFGFDSFEGLPESWRPAFDRGAFSTAGRLPSVEHHVHLVQGWFEDTLPGFCKKHQDPVALLHIDCDLYSSTRSVFSHLGMRLQAGSLLVFDEFFNYPGWEQHEFRAFSEFAGAHGLIYDYLAFNPEHEQVAVRVNGWA